MGVGDDNAVVGIAKTEHTDEFDEDQEEQTDEETEDGNQSDGE